MLKARPPRQPRAAKPPRPQRDIVLKPYSVPVSNTARLIGFALLPVLAVLFLVYGYMYAITTPYLLTEFITPLAALVLVAVWALPETKTAPTKAINNLFFAFFIVAMLWPNYLAIVLPGLPWITSVRLVGFPLAFVLLVGVSSVASFRGQVADSVQTIPRLWHFLVAFVALSFISVLLSDGRVTALNAFIIDQINWTMMFFVAAFVFLKPGNVTKWAAIYWFCGVVICFVALWEQRLGQVPWAGHIPSFLAVQDEYVQRILAGGRRLGIGAYRVQAMQSTSLGLSELLALLTPFLLHFMAGPFRVWIRIAAGLTIPLVFHIIILTEARLGAVGFFLSCLLYLLGWSIVKWRNNRGSLIGAAVVYAYPAIFVAFLGASFTITRIHTMVWGNGASQASNQGRLDQLAAGIPKVLKRPWGYGYHEGAAALDYKNLAGVMTIDNHYLNVALDLGILGLIFYWGIILIPMWYSAKYGLVKRQRIVEHTFLVPVCISLAVFFTIKAIFAQTFNHTIHFILMGMTVALVYRITKGVPGDDVPSSTR